MSLADDVNSLEHQLSEAMDDLSKAQQEIDNSRDYIYDLESELEEASAFIEYIDKTHPELRTAFNAAKKLEGERK